MAKSLYFVITEVSAEDNSFMVGNTYVRHLNLVVDVKPYKLTMALFVHALFCTTSLVSYALCKPYTVQDWVEDIELASSQAMSVLCSRMGIYLTQKFCLWFIFRSPKTTTKNSTEMGSF